MHFIKDQLQSQLLKRIQQSKNSLQIYELMEAPFLEIIKQLPNVGSPLEAGRLLAYANKIRTDSAQNAELYMESILGVTDEEYTDIYKKVLTKTLNDAIQSLSNVSNPDKQVLTDEIPAAIEQILPVIIGYVLKQRFNKDLGAQEMDVKTTIYLLATWARSELFNSCDADLPAALAFAWEKNIELFYDELYSLWGDLEDLPWEEEFATNSTFGKIYDNIRNINDFTKFVLPIWPETSNIDIRNFPANNVDALSLLMRRFEKYQGDNHLAEMFATQFKTDISMKFHEQFSSTIEGHAAVINSSLSLDNVSRAKLCKLNTLANIFYCNALDVAASEFATTQFNNFVNGNNLNDLVDTISKVEIRECCIDIFKKYGLKKAVLGEQIYIFGNIFAFFKWPERTTPKPSLQLSA